MIFNDYDRIVFAGDSVTDMGSDNPVGEGSLWDGLGHGYVRMIDNMLAAYYPELRIRITNSGISGHTSRDLLNRFDRDVLDLDPTYVSICIGINDCWRRFDSPSQRDLHVLPDEYRENVRKMIEMSKSKKGVKGIFLLTPYYMEPNKDDRMRAAMDEYGKACRYLAEEYCIEFIDIQTMLDTYFKHRHSSFIAWDRIHPIKWEQLLLQENFYLIADLIRFTLHGK